MPGGDEGQGQQILPAWLPAQSCPGGEARAVPRAHPGVLEQGLAPEPLHRRGHSTAGECCLLEKEFSNFLHYLILFKAKFRPRKQLHSHFHRQVPELKLCFKIQNHPHLSLPSLPTKLSSFGLFLCFSTGQILFWEPHGASAERLTPAVTAETATAFPWKGTQSHADPSKNPWACPARTC